MSTEMSNLTGAYAVNALTGAERAEFELHLRHCAECRQEVAELRETAARLGAATSTTPPPELRERVLAEIAETRQEPPESEEPPSDRRVRRIGRSPWPMRLAVAAAVAGIALAGAFGAIALRSTQEMAAMESNMQRMEDRGTEMAEVMRAPDADIVHSGVDGAGGTTVVSQNADKGVFMGSDLPPLPEDRVYQLWSIGDEGPSSAGLLSTQPGGETEPMVTDIPSGTTQLAITVEPPGGSPEPTTDPVMAMEMPE